MLSQYNFFVAAVAVTFPVAGQIKMYFIQTGTFPSQPNLEASGTKM